MTLLLEYRHDELGAAVVFDDDGKTAYAYLKLDEAIVGDVWLYNVIDTPQKPEWRDADARSKIPYANPAGSLRKRRLSPSAIQPTSRWIG